MPSLRESHGVSGPARLTRTIGKFSIPISFIMGNLLGGRRLRTLSARQEISCPVYLSPGDNQNKRQYRSGEENQREESRGSVVKREGVISN